LLCVRACSSQLKESCLQYSTKVRVPHLSCVDVVMFVRFVLAYKNPVTYYALRHPSYTRAFAPMRVALHTPPHGVVVV
jgi:hypothetical protein